MSDDVRWAARSEGRAGPSASADVLADGRSCSSEGRDVEGAEDERRDRRGWASMYKTFDLQRMIAGLEIACRRGRVGVKSAGARIDMYLGLNRWNGISLNLACDQPHKLGKIKVGTIRGSCFGKLRFTQSGQVD